MAIVRWLWGLVFGEARPDPEEATWHSPLKDFAREGPFWVTKVGPWWYVLRDADTPGGEPETLDRFALARPAVDRMAALAAGEE